MLPAIFFDMDGVLVDSEPEWQRAEIEVFAELGVTLRPEDCRQTKGMRIDEVVRYWYERRPWSGVSLDEAVERIISAMESRLRTRAVAKPGAVTALQAARNVARCVAIVSSSPHRLIRAVVERLAVAEHLDFSVSGEDVSYGKPHPEIYLYAAERAEIRPEQAWVIEDSLFGMIAAKAARMRCIAVPEEPDLGDPRFALADALLESLETLTVDRWQILNT